MDKNTSRENSLMTAGFDVRWIIDGVGEFIALSVK